MANFHTSERNFHFKDRLECRTSSESQENVVQHILSPVVFENRHNCVPPSGQFSFVLGLCVRLNYWRVRQLTALLLPCLFRAQFCKIVTNFLKNYSANAKFSEKEATGKMSYLSLFEESSSWHRKNSAPFNLHLGCL